MTRVSVGMAQNQLEELISAALRGELVWIVQDEQHVVQLIPAHPVPRHRQFGSAKGLISLAPEFDAPLADFCEYMP